MKRYRLWSFVLLLSIFTLALSACTAVEAPDKVVTKAFAALKTNDLLTVAKYLDVEKIQNFGGESDSFTEDSEEIMKAMFSKLDTKVISSEVEKETAVVKTEVTTIDMKSVFGKYITQAFALAFSSLGDSTGPSDEDIEKMFLDLITNETATVTNTVDIKLNKVDKEWKINVDEALQNALLGGLLSAIDDMEESFNFEESDFVDTSETDLSSSNESLSDADMLFEINNFITGDIWNDGFCDISSYIENGKNSIGETMDIAFTISQLDKAMVKLEAYNIEINAMSDPNVADAKEIWVKLYPEIKSLYSKLKEKTPTANDPSYDFDTGLFSQYSDAFWDEVY